MRILKLHHPTGHPYWQKNEFKVELPNGSFIKLLPLFGRYGNLGGYEIYLQDGNVYFVECGSSSGGGKNRYGQPKKIVDRSEYDKIEYIGKPLEISACLRNDMRANGIS